LLHNSNVIEFSSIIFYEGGQTVLLCQSYGIHNVPFTILK